MHRFVNVLRGKKKFNTYSYGFVNLEKINLEKILNNLTEITSQENRKSILHFDYKNWVDKIFNHLTTEE